MHRLCQDVRMPPIFSAHPLPYNKPRNTFVHVWKLSSEQTPESSLQTCYASLVSAAIGVHVCLGAYSGPQALDIPNKASAYLSVNGNVLIALCSG